ncbi:TRAP transporter permease [Alteribacillus sp. YIM 98480]|uniref:TRAP transporter permease n=1 Tax=Alteribacillus sp. YIM 98480 TaxID=2606599 RepID=UPI00131CB5ED|nr:TRAP transporter permease [Alteribacillus sp. YIM 98480]
MDEYKNNLKIEDTELKNKEEENESNTRNLTGVSHYLVVSIAIFMSLFHIYTLGFSPLSPWIFYSIHLGMGAVLILLLYPLTKKGNQQSKIPYIDFGLSILMVLVVSYLVINMDELIYRIGITPTNWDIVVGITILAIVLEITRRTCGILLPLIAIVFILYARFGEHIPGVLGHRGYSWERIISYLKGLDAIFSVPLAASANFVFLFIVFSAFIQVSGAGKFFIDFAMSVTGKARGGPAKTSVVASSLFGTVTGNSVANVVSSGAFTIPLMKKIGYKPKFAGAVEAVASTGGQIMPPILGSAAFIMAMLVGVPYLTVMTAAIIPALLYFTSVLLIVDLEAAKKGLKGLPGSQLPRLTQVLKNAHLIVPLFVLIFVLAVLQASPIRAALLAILSTLVVTLFKKESRMGLSKILEALSKGAQNALQMIAACATAGIIIGVLNLTGSGLKFASLIISWAGDMLPLALILTMIASIILGMGLPTTAAYLITAAVVAPALVELGVDHLISHMFVFYFACLSAITPPIALAAYAGAGISRAKPMEVAFTAMKLGLVAFIIPYMFVYGPSLLGIGSPLNIMVSIVSSLIGVFALGCALQRWFWGQSTNLIIQILLFSSALILIKPGLLSDSIGLLLIFISYVLRFTIFKQKTIEKQEESAAL